MSDYEGLDYEARVDAAMDDVLGRDGWCGVCGGWSPADPPTCDLCGVRLCGRCAVEYPDGVFECPDCAREDMDRYDRIMALAARPGVPDALVDEARRLYETSDGESAAGGTGGRGLTRTGASGPTMEQALDERGRNVGFQQVRRIVRRHRRHPLLPQAADLWSAGDAHHGRRRKIRGRPGGGGRRRRGAAGSPVDARSDARMPSRAAGQGHEDVGRLGPPRLRPPDGISGGLT